MIIIYEGVDGIGKNAFIEYEKALATDKEVIVFSYDNNFENTFKAWANEIDKWLEESKTGKLILVNRSWVSERIYANTFNRTPRISRDQEVQLTVRILARPETNFIVLLPKVPLDTYSRLVQRGDSQAVIKNWWSLKAKYEELQVKYNKLIKFIYI